MYMYCHVIWYDNIQNYPHLLNKLKAPPTFKSSPPPKSKFVLYDQIIKW